MKRVTGWLLVVILLLGLTACSKGQQSQTPGGQSGQVTLRMLVMKQAAYSDQSVQEMVSKFQDQHPDIKVDVTFVAYESLHDKIVTDQASGSGEYDVVLVDEIWPAEFAAAGFIQDLTPRLTDKMKSGVVPAVADLFKVGDKTYAIPWILDTKFLFYNKEMLSQAGFENPPRTWDELIQQARVLKQKGIVEYPLIWSWAQAEAILCDYTPLVYSWGGEILAADGTPKMQEPKAVEALKWMVSTLQEGLSNPNSTTALEEDVRNIFSRGEAAFALNWTYMYALANDPAESQVAGQVGIAPFPAGPAGAFGVSGSMGLSIAGSSRHPDEAWQLVEFLTSQENQNQYAAESLPIWEDSFEHPEQMNAPAELVPVAKEQFATIKGRPEHVPWYNQFSLKAQVALQQVLIGQKTPEQAMQDLAAEVEALRK